MNKDTQLARWLAGELTEKELEELQNSPRYATLLQIKDNFEKIESPQFNSESVLDEIFQQEKVQPKVVPLYRKYWLQAAAAIIILFGLGFVYTLPEKFSTANGETYAFVLPDDSEVLLNAGSTASFRNWNWDSNREVNLNGEAWFKVAKGKAFTVKTPQGTVTVLGTQFNVRVRGSRFDVVCFEGRVEVQHNDTKIVLSKGESITFNTGVQNTHTKSDVKEPGWIHGELVFSDEKLSGIIEELEREYNVDIETKHNSEQLFSGALPGNDLDAALKVISLNFHLNVEKKAGTIILTPVYAKP